MPAPYVKQTRHFFPCSSLSWKCVADDCNIAFRTKMLHIFHACLIYYTKLFLLFCFYISTTVPAREHCSFVLDKLPHTRIHIHAMFSCNNTTSSSHRKTIPFRFENANRTMEQLFQVKIILFVAFFVLCVVFSLLLSLYIPPPSLSLFISRSISLFSSLALFSASALYSKL